MEQLEGRTVLSAGLSPSACFDLTIKGTDIQYSPLGLPAAMGGDIYLAGQAAAGHASIGHYQESLTPILMDINGDSVPDFVGTQGVATFSFFAGAPVFGCGSITTADTSYIQGVTAAGQLQVGSQGAIVGSTCLFVGLAGGFGSQSTVGLGASFQMQTNVHFTVNKPMGPVFSVLAAAADLYAGLNAAIHTQITTHTQQSVLTNNTQSTGGSNVSNSPTNGKSTAVSPPTSTSAHDSIFTEDTNWTLDHLSSRPALV